MQKVLFEIITPLDFKAHVTEEYWGIIVSIKHPVMKGLEDEVKLVLGDSDETRQSKKDRNVFLFYRSRGLKRWFCAVVKNDNSNGFLITAYPTDNIKEGIIIWKK